jgi:outer membrane protein assembly factor BamB
MADMDCWGYTLQNRYLCGIKEFVKFHERRKDVGMRKSWRNIFLVCVLAVLLGCAGSKPAGWGQFHGDLSNRGFQMIDSGFALSSTWISKPYKITSSSLVIGKDYHEKEVVYAGTADGALVAIRSEDGSEKWKRFLDAADSGVKIVSSPAVSEDGDIYVISNRRSGEGRAVSTLHKVDQFSLPEWSYTFPENGFTTGSPKIISSPEGNLIFVYLTVGMLDDIQGELIVLRDDGNRAQPIARKSLSTCRFNASDGQPLEDIFEYYENMWNLVGSFPIEFESDLGRPSDSFIDPTIAIVTGREKLLIAIADNLCSIGAFEWDGAELTVLWHQKHNSEKHSSAAVSSNGLMVFGRRDGKVLAYDVGTGVEMWEYDAGQAVFATPAIPDEQLVFVVSKDHLQVVNALDGTLVHDNKIPRKLPLLGTTRSSPAITSNRVYVATLEMMTATYDLKARGHDTTFHGNGLSSIAVGRDGSVYGAAADGTILKYGGTD